MSSQDDDAKQGVLLLVLFGFIALVITFVMIVALTHRGAPATATRMAVLPAATAPVPVLPDAPALVVVDAAAAAQATRDAASIKVENGVVKFYFASGKADLAAGAGDALANLVKEARTDRKLVISGFHDATGDAARNAALALERARAVRAALKSAGVADGQIELKKPEQTAGGDNDAEARRVEVALQ